MSRRRRPTIVSASDGQSRPISRCDPVIGRGSGQRQAATRENSGSDTQEQALARLRRRGVPPCGTREQCPGTAAPSSARYGVAQGFRVVHRCHRDTYRLMPYTPFSRPRPRGTRALPTLWTCKHGGEPIPIPTARRRITGPGTLAAGSWRPPPRSTGRRERLALRGEAGTRGRRDGGRLPRVRIAEPHVSVSLLGLAVPRAGIVRSAALRCLLDPLSRPTAGQRGPCPPLPGRCLLRLPRTCAPPSLQPRAARRSGLVRVASGGASRGLWLRGVGGSRVLAGPLGRLPPFARAPHSRSARCFTHGSATALCSTWDAAPGCTST